MDPETDQGDDIVVTDKELFDQALTDPVETKAETTEVKPEETTEQPRDEHGRFAAKTEAAAEVKEQGPPKIEPQPEPQKTAEPAKAEPDQHRVPLSELLNEREKRQRFEHENGQLRQQVQQIQQWIQQQTQPKAQPQEPANLFEHPNEYLQEWIAPQRQEFAVALLQIKDGLSKEMAITQFGEKAIAEALADLGNHPQGQHEWERILASPHPYGELVKWHKSVLTQREVGADPSAWFQKKLDEKMKDPAFQAQVLELARQQTQQQQQVPGRPASPPNIQLPPSLSSIPAAAGRVEEQGDLSDQSLYRHATAR